MRQIVITLISLGLMVDVGLAQETDLPPRLDGIVLAEAIDATTASRGAFTIDWDGEALRVLHAERVVWATPPGGFLAAANGTETVEEVRGNFFFNETRERVCMVQTLDALTTADDTVILSGTLSDSDGQCTEYSLRFDATGDHTLRFDLQFTDSTYDRAFLEVATNADERFYGFGMQFSFVDLKGQRVPVWVSEQGIGRGAEPITTGANIVARSGGTPFTTYAPIPHYLTSQSRSLMLETTTYNVFDLTGDDRLQIEVWDAGFSGQIIAGETPADLIREYTGLVGRMRPLPEWLTTGAVVGIQGGTERVREIYEELQTYEVPISAFWLQDWVGRRTTSFGEQLWWNWVLDRERYPDWDALVSDFNADDIQVLTYASPFITNAAEKPGVTRNLYAEAVENGYFVTRPDGTPYATLVTDFDAALVDLTNPAARDWLKTVLIEEVLGVGAVGYMADFGEALPYDAVLQGGTGAELHNVYPVLWAELNAEVLAEAGLSENGLFFTRSGYTRSPAYSTLFWLGDQLVDWDASDGIKTAVIGLLSSGFSGYQFNHSDIGGYTAVVNPVAEYRRSEELLLRWMELNAFTSIYRTHEGNLPAENAQFYDNATTYAHFARFAQVYAAWDFYRRDLITEAAITGLPVVRHPIIHYPDDPAVYDLTYQQFMVGDQFMIAPVLDPQTETVSVYLPAGDWVHLWSGNLYTGGQPVTVPAPLGEPGVFYPSGSTTGEQFAAALRAAGLLTP